MSNRRLMSDRDHAVALSTAVENLIADKEVQYTVYSSPAFQRLVSAMNRANRDLFPEY